MAEQSSADRSIYDPVTDAHVDEVERMNECGRCHYDPGSLELQGLCLGCWQHVQARALHRDLLVLGEILEALSHVIPASAAEALPLIESALANPLLEGTDHD